jgi:hypothetical protein
MNIAVKYLPNGCAGIAPTVTKVVKVVLARKKRAGGA